jgi:hypothetical protein
VWLSREECKPPYTHRTFAIAELLGVERKTSLLHNNRWWCPLCSTHLGNNSFFTSPPNKLYRVLCWRLNSRAWLKMSKLKGKLFPDTEEHHFTASYVNIIIYATMSERNHQFLKMNQKKAKICKNMQTEGYSNIYLTHHTKSLHITSWAVVWQSENMTYMPKCVNIRTCDLTFRTQNFLVNLT